LKSDTNLNKYFYRTSKHNITIVSQNIKAVNIHSKIGQNKEFLMYLFFLKNRIVKFDFPCFIVKSVHEKLCRFPIFKFFRYQSYMVYLILYFQCAQFETVSLERLSLQGNTFPIIESLKISMNVDIPKHRQEVPFASFRTTIFNKNIGVQEHASCRRA